jgi:hypothetical protein
MFQMEQLRRKFLRLELQTEESFLQASPIGFIACTVRCAIQCVSISDKPHIQFIGESDNCSSAFVGRPVDGHTKLQFPTLCGSRNSVDVGTNFFPAVQNMESHFVSNLGAKRRKSFAELNPQDLRRASI